MSAMSDAVDNGPRATSAKTAHIEARIKLADAKASALQQSANNHDRKAKGDGPMAKYHRGQATALANAADRRRAEANDLRTDLAKAKADEAARNVKHVKRTVASTAAEGLTPKAAGQAGQAKPSQDKTGGGQVARLRLSPAEQAFDKAHGRATRLRDEAARAEQAAIRHPDDKRLVARAAKAAQSRDKAFAALAALRSADNDQPTTKGTPAMTAVSGEAVNIEQTRANLDQLKSQVTDLRGSFEGMAGSLASGGLNKLAGEIATADDALNSVESQIAAAETKLAEQEVIAEAAQAAGEMHTDTSFYGA